MYLANGQARQAISSGPVANVGYPGAVSASARTDAVAELIGRDAESALLDELIDGLPNAGGVLTAALAHLIVDEHGFAWLPEQDFVGHFAADVDPVKARVQ